MKLVSVLLALLLPVVSFAGTATGSFQVSLTITESSKTSSKVSSNVKDYQNYEGMSILTDVADGKSVDIIVNGAKVASAISHDGTINVDINWKSEDSVKLEFRSQGKEVQVLQTAYTNANTVAPKMAQKTYTHQVTMQNPDGTESVKNVEVKSILLEY